MKGVSPSPLNLKNPLRKTHKKGVSPLIASVFLIVLVVTIASIVTTWMTTVVTSTQGTVGERTKQTVECSNAAINIDNVFVTNGAANVIVRNSGFVNNLELQAGQIYTRLGENFTSTNTPITTFDKGDIATVKFVNPGITCLTFNEVLITTNCGSVTDTYDAEPECV